MIFRPFHYFDRGCATYLFGCGTLGRCAVVDPRAADVDSYIAFAASKNMRITHVIDTHVQADHRDVVDVADGSAPADAVTLDRVVCCYPSYDRLLEHALRFAGHAFAFSYPRDRWFVRLGIWFENTTAPGSVERPA